MVLSLSRVEEERILAYKRRLEQIRSLPTATQRRYSFICLYNETIRDRDEEYFFERHVVGDGCAERLIGRGPIEQQPSRLAYMLEHFDLV